MKHIKPLLFLIILCFSILSCKQQQARMPISHSSGVFLKQSVERNKKLIKEEEKKIDSIIKSDSKINYLASKKGYWYYYISQNEMDNTFPEKGDIVTYTYEIKNLSNQVIYSEKELGEQKYIVDKQEILMGLRDGIKLMHQNETVQFLFPSHMAYGYHGDDKKIETNEPIMCKVTLVDLKKTAKKAESSSTEPVSTDPAKMKDQKEDKQSSSTPQ
jgi:gliding motility-associated peptidyl-prolyl isomerase